MIGELNKRLTIQDVVYITDSVGEPIETWVDRVTVWGKIDHVQDSAGAVEFFDASQVNERSLMKITIRYLKNITGRNRLIFGDRVFRIIGIVNKKEANRFLELTCEEVVTGD